MGGASKDQGERRKAEERGGLVGREKEGSKTGPDRWEEEGGGERRTEARQAQTLKEGR